MLLHSLPEYRLRLGWSQQQLADRSGLSRAEISAIETGRVVPSTAAALSLARAFDCSVEALFSLRKMNLQAARWAWKPPRSSGRFWQARVRGQLRRDGRGGGGGVTSDKGEMRGALFRLSFIYRVYTEKYTHKKIHPRAPRVQVHGLRRRGRAR